MDASHLNAILQLMGPVAAAAVIGLWRQSAANARTLDRLEGVVTTRLDALEKQVDHLRQTIQTIAPRPSIPAREPPPRA